MTAISFLVLCAAVVSAASATARIAGPLTTIDKYPTMVSISNTENLIYWQQSCGSSILNNRAVLTAAHCTGSFAYERQRVRVGSSFAQSGGTVYGIRRVIIHPNYGSFMLDSDIAILHINGFITYSNVAQPGRFAGTNYPVAADDAVWAAGWGVYYHGSFLSEQLRHTQLWILDHDVCKTRYIGGAVTEGMVCALPREAGFGQCSADSGGPIFHNGVIVGVLSFGGGVCGSDFFPSVSIGVSRYISWIQENA
ncbi:trypsin, alkaline B-like [Anticarsia gemmatalis]|uniref:trypsin, alkaline B-like n=1 Tax=Anticarsia gemmatalis TaxID=129554 RepID=UPI003F7604D6